MHKLTQEQKNTLILEMMQKFMGEETVKTLEDLEVKDVSGFSNNTLVLSNKNHEEGSDKPRQLVLRFFESAIADLKAEGETFRLMSSQGLGPKPYFADERMRVEECIIGRTLQATELRDPETIVSLVELICDMNYNPELIAKSKEIKGAEAVFFKDFTGETGWFSLIKGLRQTSNWATIEDEDVKGIQMFFDAVMQNDEAFVKDFQGCLPENVREDIDIVFSHNDFQENNVMVTSDEAKKIYLIDFEYSQMNYRGADLAALFNEVMIVYNLEGENPFEIHYDWMLKEEELEKVMEVYLKRYHSKFYKGEDAWEVFYGHERPILHEQIKRCVLLTHAMWAFGALLIVPSFEENPRYFMGYHLYAWKRLEMLAQIKEKFLGEHFQSLTLPPE